MTPQSKRGFDAIEFPSAIANRPTTAAAAHRPGRRTGTALIASGGTAELAGRGGALTVAADRWRYVDAPLILGSVIAPSATPHFVRIDVYVWFLISTLNAARIG